MSINPEEFLRNLVTENFRVDKEKVKKELDEWKSSKINIAFVGERGCGKSTLINAIRDLFPNDSGAAPVNIIHETKYPTPYPHPDNENFILWDLPGIFNF
jgi:predicted GTPase